MPEKLDPLVLAYARLATATMSGQSIEVFQDGAICDRQLYNLFSEFKQRVVAASTTR